MKLSEYIDEMNVNGQLEYVDYNNLRDMVDELEAENAELHARLEKAVELKANVGDTIYCIHGISNPTITDWEVKEIRITDHNYIVICGHSGTNDRRVEVSEHYKKWWFTDRAKAEARLAELKGGDKQ